MRDNLQIKQNVDSRIMLDAAFFRHMNPNYGQPKIEKYSLKRPKSFDPSAHMYAADELSTPWII